MFCVTSKMIAQVPKYIFEPSQPQVRSFSVAYPSYRAALISSSQIAPRRSTAANHTNTGALPTHPNRHQNRTSVQVSLSGKARKRGSTLEVQIIENEEHSHKLQREAWEGQIEIIEQKHSIISYKQNGNALYLNESRGPRIFSFYV